MGNVKTAKTKNLRLAVFFMFSFLRVSGIMSSDIILGENKTKEEGRWRKRANIGGGWTMRQNCLRQPAPKEIPGSSDFIVN